MNDETIRMLLEARAFRTARIVTRGLRFCVEIATADGWRLAETDSGKPRMWRSIDSAARWLRRLGIGEVQLSFGERALHRAVGRQPLKFTLPNGNWVTIDEFHVKGTYIDVLVGVPKGDRMEEKLREAAEWAKAILPKSPKPVLVTPDTMKAYDPFRYLPPLTFCANFVSGPVLDPKRCGTHASMIWFGDEQNPTPIVSHAKRLFERVQWDEVAESFDY